MPPKRPRVVPSQTNLSVQDVRDYSTPDGAAMANEEMRRLKMALQQVQEQQAQAVADQQAAVAPSAPSQGTPPQDRPPVAITSYTWTVKAERYREAVVENKQVVVFRGVNGINVSQVGRTITIAQNVLSWIGRADSGTINVRNEGIVRIRGVNGVVTRAQTGNPVGTLEIDRPLRIYQRMIQIGDAGTVGLNFHNHSNHINKNEHNQVHFQVQDEGNGIRRVLGWAKKGDTSSLQGALSTVWIKDAEQDIATAIGYNVANNQYVEQLFIGPWGWQNAINSTVPYVGSGYSNNAKDTEWDWGWSGRFSPMSAYTRFGKVSKAGLYLVSGTTQGMRYIASNVATTPGAPYVNLRLHYHILHRHYVNEVIGYRTSIYKTLDICPWDLWGLDIGDIEGMQLFVSQMSSVPWSVQGTAQIWLEPDDEVAHLITFNYGNNGETRIAFEVTYHAFEAVLVADETTLDPATQVDLAPVNYNEPPASYHSMQFINV